MPESVEAQIRSLAEYERYRREIGPCPCGDQVCTDHETGYPFCGACGDHHRPPDCEKDAEGFALAPCGCRWADLDGRGHTCDPDADF